MEPISRRPGKFASAAKVKRETVEESPVTEVTVKASDAMRPAMREDDSRTAAAKRAAQLREHLGDVVEGQDDFYMPLDEIPDGWTYEWKRKSVLGQEDPSYQVSLERMGWEPVPADRHPSYMPTGGKYATIERDGMILMERPMELTEEARRIELKKARQQVRTKEEQLNSAPQGQFGRDNKGNSMAKVSKSYEAMAIPNE